MEGSGIMWFLWENQRRLLRRGVSVLGLESGQDPLVRGRWKKVLRQGNRKQEHPRRLKPGLVEITLPAYIPGWKHPT